MLDKDFDSQCDLFIAVAEFSLSEPGVDYHAAVDIHNQSASSSISAHVVRMCGRPPDYRKFELDTGAPPSFEEALERRDLMSQAVNLPNLATDY